MKSWMWAGILAVLLIVCVGIGIFFMAPGEQAVWAEILSDGEVVKTVDLRIDQEFTVETKNGGYNVVTVKDGKIAVTAASCPDHYCKDRGFCSGGVDIVCLPNKMVIRFLGEQEIDAVLG
jgi:hypothetical protein